MTILSTCPECGTRWTGTRMCHCVKCCVTFSGVDAFDRHQTRTDKGASCKVPAMMPRLEIVRRTVSDHPVWGQSGSADWDRGE